MAERHGATTQAQMHLVAFSLATLGIAKPAKTKPKGRKCICGQVLSIYNLGSLCSVCERKQFTTFRTEK